MPSSEIYTSNNHMMPAHAQKDQLHLSIPYTEVQYDYITSSWLCPAAAESSYKSSNRRSWAAFIPRRSSSQHSRQSRFSQEMCLSSPDTSEQTDSTRSVPLTPTKRKRSSWVDSPVPAPLQQITAHSDHKIAKHAKFDPASGNYRRYGARDWAGFVSYCEKHGVPEQLPKCFVYKGDKVLQEQLRLCVLRKLAQDSVSVLGGLSLEDRRLLEDLWQADGGRPKHMEHRRLS